MRANVYSPAISGVIGGVSIPLSYIILFWLTALIYANKNLIGLTPENSISDGVQMFLIFIWILVIIPFILAVIGALSLKISNRSYLGKNERYVIPMASGIISIITGIILFSLFSSLTPPPENISAYLTRGLPYFISSITGAITNPMMAIAIILCSLISLAGSIAYRHMFTIK